MDPNATLQNIRDYLAREDRGEPLSTADDMDFAENVRALDEWLSRDGFLPEPWCSSSALMAGQRATRWYVR